MCFTPQQNYNLTAASSINMENSQEESLLSAVEDFSPQPSPNPADYSDSDRDEREEEEPRGFGVRPYTFEPADTSSSHNYIRPRVQGESSIFLKRFSRNA